MMLRHAFQERASRPKTRTGCLTCKSRHVKCDENKPVCGQCNRAGRRCEGYDPRVSQKDLQSRALATFQHSLSRGRAQIIVSQGTPQEREYIHLFCTQTTRAIAGFFVSELWCQLLPQLGQGHPVVRHAIAAVGAAHRQYLGYGGQRRDSRFILQQYNLAIRCLVDHMSSPRNRESQSAEIDLTLMVCCLFVCLEILRDNHEKALDHVEAGLNIIPTREKASERKGLQRELADIFSRFHIELSLFGRQPKRYMTFLSYGDEWAASGFRCVAHARKALNEISNQSIGIIGTLGIKGAPYSGKSVSDEAWARLNTHIQNIKREIDAWRISFEALMRTETGQRADPRAPLALRIHYHLSITWTLSILRRRETEMDQFNGNFAAMVDLAEELLQIDANRPERSRAESCFNLDPGVIRPLHWTAIKCRDPLIRRKALWLMSKYPRKESFWNWRRSVIIGEKILKIEEAALADLPIECRIPQDHHRVYETAYHDDSLNRQTWVYMWSKPDGPHRELRSRIELVDWSR